jgi:hypothetical protein
MSEQRSALRRLRLIRLAGLSACLLIALSVATLKPMAAQGLPTGPRGPLPQPIGQRAGGGIEDMGNNDPVEAERRLRALNEMRQKSIVSDTNKLLKLANELNAEIASTNSETLTPDQLRKFATIEKLARSVKEKMSTPVGGLPAYQQPPPPMMR